MGRLRAQKRGGEEKGLEENTAARSFLAQGRGRAKRTEETRPLKKVRLEEEEEGGGGDRGEKRDEKGGREAVLLRRSLLGGGREGGRRVYTTYVWAAAEAEAEAASEAVAEAAAAEMREEKETWGAFGSVFRPCDEATERTDEEERLKVGRRREGRLLSFSPLAPPSPPIVVIVLFLSPSFCYVPYSGEDGKKHGEEKKEAEL